MKKIQIPQKDVDEFFRKETELNTEAKELFSRMGAEDQRRVLNSGPLNIFRDPMEMYKFRVAISRDREKEIADRKGGEFVAKEAAEYEVTDWVKSNKSYIGEDGAKQLDMFGPADQWRIISEGPASENMDPTYIIQTRAKRSRELADTVSVMFAQRREQANESVQAKAAAKPLFNPALADTVQAFFTRVVGCEVPDAQRRTGGFGVQHVLEEDRSKLVGTVKGIDGVVEILKTKYDCLKGERYRVVGDRGGPAGMWRLDGGKTIPKTHVKEGGWKWVLEEPEPEAKLAKPPPVATAPVQTFMPKEHRKAAKEAEGPSSESAESDDRAPKKKGVMKRKVKKESEVGKKGIKKPAHKSKRTAAGSENLHSGKRRRIKEDTDDSRARPCRGSRSQGSQRARRNSKSDRSQEDSRDKDSCDEDSRDGGSQMSSRRGRPRPRSRARR